MTCHGKRPQKQGKGKGRNEEAEKRGVAQGKHFVQPWGPLWLAASVWSPKKRSPILPHPAVPRGQKRKFNFVASSIEVKIKQWINVVGHVGDALIFVHSQAVIDNDLKPNNMVLGKRGEDFNPVIIDFGKSLRIGGQKAFSVSA